MPRLPQVYVRARAAPYGSARIPHAISGGNEEAEGTRNKGQGTWDKGNKESPGPHEFGNCQSEICPNSAGVTTGRIAARSALAPGGQLRWPVCSCPVLLS